LAGVLRDSGQISSTGLDWTKRRLAEHLAERHAAEEIARSRADNGAHNNETAGTPGPRPILRVLHGFARRPCEGAMMALLAPPCSNCRRPIPIRYTYARLGKPFACTHCGQWLKVDNNLIVPPAGLAAWYLLKGQVSGLAGHGLLVSGILLTAILAVRLMAKPRPAAPPAERGA